MIESWVKSARASLDKLEWELEYIVNERTKMSVQVNDLEKEVKRLRKEVNHAKVTIDEWDNKGGPCVTVHLEGCEYVGMLRLHKDENGKVIE